MIAPFWADIDTRPEDGGHIWYRESNNAAFLSKIASIIQSSFHGVGTFNPHFMFIATWDHVGYYPEGTDKVYV